MKVVIYTLLVCMLGAPVSAQTSQPYEWDHHVEATLSHGLLNSFDTLNVSGGVMSPEQFLAFLTMDATTFKDPRVAGRLEDFSEIKFRAEKPNDPRIKGLMDRYGLPGLPGYVLLNPKRDT